MINSHYVPQFILRNFYTNDKITYCDLDKESVQLRNSRSVFSEEGYYPEGIERDLCVKAEHIFANLFHNKIEKARNSIILSWDEMFTIKKYLVVCAIRYKHDLSEMDKEIIETLGPSFKVDYDKSLNEILACENNEDLFKMINEVPMRFADVFLGKDEKILDELNIPLWAELKDIICSYLIFVRTREKEKFIIPDIGRGICEGPLAYKKVDATMQMALQTMNPQYIQLMQLTSTRDYTFYPLSKELIVISMNSFYKVLTDSEFHVNVIMPEDCPTVSKALGFGDRNMITPPKVKGYGNKKEYVYDIKYLTTQDVCHFNSLCLTEAKRYIACGELSEIQNSVEYAEKNEYTKRKIGFLKNEKSLK